MKASGARTLPALEVLAIAGCASAPPTTEIAASEAALGAAVQAGANQAAPAEMALARQKLMLMRRSMQAGDYKPARWLAEQARVDAELASIKALNVRGKP